MFSTSPMVSAHTLVTFLEDPKLIILDASTRKAVNNTCTPIEGVFLPDARAFDFEQKICDTTSAYAHMMPTAEQFEQHVRALGVNNDSTIVVYDKRGLYSAPRAWWMFKAMGFNSVYVLDGGLPGWVENNLPVVSQPSDAPNIGNFSAKPQTELIYSVTQVEQAIEDDTIQIIDARSAGRFNGTAPEPRPGLRSGHIPSSINVHFPSVLNEHYLLDKAALAAKLPSAPSKKWLVSCGSGLTACIVMLAATVAGHTNLALYDGSWNEWGAEGASFPIE